MVFYGGTSRLTTELTFNIDTRLNHTQRLSLSRLACILYYEYLGAR
jgi:hypothetical protein